MQIQELNLAKDYYYLLLLLLSAFIILLYPEMWKFQYRIPVLKKVIFFNLGQQNLLQLFL